NPGRHADGATGEPDLSGGAQRRPLQTPGMSANEFRLPFGANVETDGVRFRVWSPGSQRVDVVIEEDGGQIDHPMQPEPEGFFSGFVPGKGAGTRYRFRIDGDQ